MLLDQANRVSFLSVMEKWSTDHQREDWPPLATLVALETELLGNVTDLDVARAAGVKTVREGTT